MLFWIVLHLKSHNRHFFIIYILTFPFYSPTVLETVAMAMWHELGMTPCGEHRD